MPSFLGQFYFFPFSNFILLRRNNKRMCQKSETQFLRSMCEETDAVLIVFSCLNLAGMELFLFFFIYLIFFKCNFIYNSNTYTTCTTITLTFTLTICLLIILLILTLLIHEVHYLYLHCLYTRYTTYTCTSLQYETT